MGNKPTLDEGQLHSLNFRSVRDWIERNKNKIKAMPGKTLLYSGSGYDLDLKLDKQGQQILEGTPMWARLEKVRKRLEDRHVPCNFQTLEDVLKAIREHPAVVDKDRREVRFSSAFEFFRDLVKELDDLLPDAKKIHRESWRRLSELFAANAAGDIKILDGVAADYTQLKQDKDFIFKELPALLKNPNLSDKSRKLVEDKISKYGNQFDRRHTELIAHLRKGRSDLTSK